MDTASFSLQSTWVCGRSLLSQRLNPCGLFLISSAVRNVGVRRLKSYCKLNKQQSLVPSTVEKKVVKKPGKIEHHLWKKRYSTGSGTKALDLIRIVSEQPNVKEAVYGALDKWVAWELEFPLIAAAKALKILKKRNQWIRVIQVSKWMLSKGQGATMTTYDTLLLAFDMESRIDEAASLWNMILLTHRHSVSKRLFSRMIALYDHHRITEKIVEVFGDMEELGVKPDEDTVRRIARAFDELGQAFKKELVIRRYGLKWKYIHFNGERVRVRSRPWED
ncbi:Pentatricopeptide repeat-containing protein [Drosera capensis]